jgi:2-succinyl-6-hydroxy-2,4-cyclohexadiene-1-carboxylate synthase
MRDGKVARVRAGGAGGIEMEYEEHGAGGRPFVLVHGFTGSRDDWREMLPRLAARGRTLAPDLRGHGGSENPGRDSAYAFERLAEDVIGFLDAVDAPRCDLLGHSMGGMVALRVALAQPERVASLVLMDTAAAPIARDARRFFEASAKIARERGMEALFEAARAAGERDPNRPQAAKRCMERMGREVYWARIRAKMTAMDPAAFCTLGPLLTDHPPLVDRLGEIRCPTTVIVGAEDAPFLAASDVLAKSIAGARLEVIDGAAHSPQLESPEAWLAAVLRHLDEARRPA